MPTYPDNPSTPPPTADTQSLSRYLLRMADDHLVLAQRLGEWVAAAPDLEEDIALTNIGLDCLGIARALYTYAGEVEGKNRGEDDLAMFRDEREYYNLLLVEQPNRDFGWTMVRQLFFDAFYLERWGDLLGSPDPTLAGIAAKAIKEATYHLQHSRTWVLRLGDGTEESHHRCQQAVDGLWRFTGEMFLDDDLDQAISQAGIASPPSTLQTGWSDLVESVLTEATLELPTGVLPRTGGRSGFHSEYLGHLLAEMQWLQRSYPGWKW